MIKITKCDRVWGASNNGKVTKNRNKKLQKQCCKLLNQLDEQTKVIRA